MDTSSSKTKFSFLWALDISKGILSLIFAIAGIKVLLSPGEDPINVILWRLVEISLVVVPAVILCGFVYALINYDSLVASEIESQKNSKSK
ncbi:hypothetical protein [Catenovulum adriaticum]|uniref:Uncharacterized protein n=1 Tax=Catenovulum adriaticum TaxID=2984846 RepID=A0ABY7AJ38_9ALTE|nr:hypothetical protein [Catenovulum sp. TS8]WAJ69603.1 hypothetical protein OLW01_10580 [Catenovulum sp. TS8]